MTFVYLMVRGSVLLLCSLNFSSGVDFGKCQHGSQGNRSSEVLRISETMLAQKTLISFIVILVFGSANRPEAVEKRTDKCNYS